MKILVQGPPPAPGQRVRPGVTAEGSCGECNSLGWRDGPPRAGRLRLRLDAHALVATTRTHSPP